MSNSKNTILFISNESKLLGATNVLLHIIDYLHATQKYNILVSCPPTEGHFKEILQQKNITTFTPNCLRDYYFHISKPAFLPIRILRRIIDNLKLLFFFYQFLSKNKSTIVYANTSAVRYIALPALLSRTRLLWHVHEYSTKPLKQKFHSLLIKLCSDKIIVHSPFLISKMGISERGQKKVIFFRYFTILERKEYPETEFNRLSYDLIFAGKIGFEKGVLDLLSAVKNVVEIKPDLKVALAGVFVDKDKDLVLSFVEKHRLENHITFCGFVPDLNRAILDSKVVVLPTYRDYMPILVMEALLLEKPVICTDVGDIRSIVTHNKNGIIISPGNVQQLTDAILQILDEEAYQRFVLGARAQKAELLSDANDYEKIEQAIDNLFHKRKA